MKDEGIEGRRRVVIPETGALHVRSVYLLCFIVYLLPFIPDPSNYGGEERWQTSVS